MGGDNKSAPHLRVHTVSDFSCSASWLVCGTGHHMTLQVRQTKSDNVTCSCHEAICLEELYRIKNKRPHLVPMATLLDQWPVIS